MRPDDMGRRLLPFTAGAMCLALASCDARSAPTDAPHVDDLPRLGYVEEVRIGDRDDPDAGFSRIGDIEVGADGTVYVLETQAREVRVFDPDGLRVGTVGGPGQGPGEFGGPRSIGLLGDTLWVLEWQRLSWFGPDGRLVQETPGLSLPVETDVPGMIIEVGLGEPRDDGLVGSSYRRIMSGGAADRPYHHPVMRFDRGGRVVDTIRWDTVIPPPTIHVGGRALHPPALRPLNPLVEDIGDERVELRWRASEEEPDGTLDVLRRTTMGDTLVRTGVRYPKVPVPESVRDSLLEIPEGIGRMYGVSDAELTAAMRSGVDLPAYRPPVRSIEVDRDGGLWIELSGESADSTAWVLLNPDLTPRGRLLLPARMEPRHVDGAAVWAVEPDELDVPWLVRLTVQ